MAATSKANLRQTSSNVSATLTASLVQSGLLSDVDSIMDFFKSTSDWVFDELVEIFDSEPKPEPRNNNRRRSGGGNISGEEAGNTKFDRGVFSGMTIAEVYELSKEEAQAKGYSNAGKVYIAWLSKNSEWPFMQRRAKAFIEFKRAETGGDE